MNVSNLLTSPGFVASALGLLAAVSLLVELFLEDRRRVDDRLRDERQRRVRAGVQQSRIFKEFKANQGRTVDEETPTIAERLTMFIGQSGVEVTLRRLVTISFGAAGGAAVVATFLTQNWIVAFGCSMCGLVAPFFAIHTRRNRRIRQLRDQLPEAFDLMKRAIQAGQTMTNAMHLVANQCCAPIADEFACCNEQQNLGLPQEATLRDLARRTGVVELQMFAVALVLQRQAGGNPVELLDNLSEVVRQRTRLAMRVRAITSEGRMQAIVLALLPVVSLFGIYIIDPVYASVLLDRPRLLALVGGFVIVGVFWIRRIVQIEF